MPDGPQTCEEFADVIVLAIPNISDEDRDEVRDELLGMMNLDELRFLAHQIEPEAKRYAKAISLIKRYGQGTFRRLYKGGVQWTRVLKSGENASETTLEYLWTKEIETMVAGGILEVVDAFSDGTARTVRLLSGDETCD